MTCSDSPGQNSSPRNPMWCFSVAKLGPSMLAGRGQRWWGLKGGELRGDMDAVRQDEALLDSARTQAFSLGKVGSQPSQGLEPLVYPSPDFSSIKWG